VGGNVTAPLFDGFTLMHRQRAAEAALEQAKAQYRGTVITAFQNVGDTLTALRYDAETLAAAVNAEKAARRSLDLTRAQLANGLVSPLAALTAEQAYYQALTAQVQAQAQRLSDTAALFQSLGGGWWNLGEEMDRTVSEGIANAPTQQLARGN
jgi:outer membrane protein TolC